MKEVISKSKYYKQLHQREREESLALTEELDEDLGSLLPHLSFKNNSQKEPSKDDFDMLTKELMYEARARPLNRLPTEEEIAQKQRDRLEFLEKERLRRMRGEENMEEEEEEEEDEEIEEMSEDDIEDSDSETEKKPKKDKKKQKKFIKPLTEQEIKLIESALNEDSIPFLIHVPGEFEEFESLLNKKTPSQMRTITARMLASNNANLGPTYKEHMTRMFEFSIQYFEKQINEFGGNTENDSQIQILDVISQVLYTLLPSIVVSAIPFVKEKLIQMHQSLDENLEVPSLSNANSNRNLNMIWRPSDFFFFKILANLFPVTDFQHPIITPALLLMNRFIVFVPIYTIPHIQAKLFLSSMVYHVS